MALDLVKDRRAVSYVIPRRVPPFTEVMKEDFQKAVAQCRRPARLEQGSRENCLWAQGLIEGRSGYQVDLNPTSTPY